ncbi:MAG: PilZ domain-containing protein [Desulfovibrionaceae bacterium]
MHTERERRLWARYRCGDDVHCRLEVADGACEFEVCDISRGGMRVKGCAAGALAGWSVGEAVRIASARPVRAMLASEDGLFRDIAGRVIWMGGPSEEPGMGIAFNEPLPTALDAMLRLFLESEAGRAHGDAPGGAAAPRDPDVFGDPDAPRDSDVDAGRDRS